MPATNRRSTTVAGGSYPQRFSAVLHGDQVQMGI
jgi:hypothetical protein